MEASDLLSYIVTPVAQIALIMAIAEVIKRAGVNTKYIPVINLILGLILGVLIFGLVGGQNIILSTIAGIAEGACAGGFFDNIKSFTK